MRRDSRRRETGERGSESDREQRMRKEERTVDQTSRTSEASVWNEDVSISRQIEPHVPRSPHFYYSIRAVPSPTSSSRSDTGQRRSSPGTKLSIHESRAFFKRTSTRTSSSSRCAKSFAGIARRETSHPGSDTSRVCKMLVKIRVVEPLLFRLGLNEEGNVRTSASDVRTTTWRNSDCTNVYFYYD